MKNLPCVASSLKILLFVTPWTVACQASPWDSAGKNTGGGSHSILQGIFLTQGLNSGLPHCRQVLYHLSHQRSPPNRGFPAGSDSKESACNAGGLGSVPELERSPGEGNGTPLQYSCLENSMDRGAWWATVCGVAKSRTH